MTEKVISERSVTVALPNGYKHTVKQKIIRIKPEMWIDPVEHKVWFDVTAPVLKGWADAQEVRLVK